MPAPAKVNLGADPWEEAAKSMKLGPSPAGPSAAPAPANDDYKIWQQSSEPEKPGFASSFGNGIASGPLNPMTWAATGNAMLHPRSAVKGISDQNNELFNEARDSFKHGDVLKGVRQGAEYLVNGIPGLGSSAEDAAQEFDKGNYGAGLGKTAALGVNTAASIEAPKAIPGAVRAVRGLTKVNPEVATERAWRPGPADSDFPKIAPQAVSEVKTFGKPGTRTNAGTIEAAGPAIEAHQNALEGWMNRARQAGVTVSGDDIVRATEAAIPQTMKLESPAEAARLVEQARQAYGGRRFNVDDFRQYLKEKNAGSQSFYGKSNSAQQAGITSGTPAAIEKAQGDAIRDVLYRALDPEGEGAGPRQIQERTGSVINLRKAAERRSNAITGEKAVRPIEGAGNFLGGLSRLVGLPFHGDVQGSLGRMAHPFQGPSDALIGKLYGQTPDAPPLPSPPSAQYPAIGPARQLGPAIPRVGPIPDASSVNVTTGPQLTGRMLTSGSVKAGPIPDTSGAHVTTGRPLVAPLGRQLPAGPSIRPPTETSGPAGDVTDLMPIKDPVTGQTHYAARPRPLAVPNNRRGLGPHPPQ